MNPVQFTRRELNKIHSASLTILQDTGMRIIHQEMRSLLKSMGYKVDESSKIVKFPPKAVEQTLENIKKEITSGRPQILLNGDIASKTDGKIRAKFGGACIEYVDYDRKIARQPTKQDLINMLQLGEAIPEVEYVGNPLMYLFEDDGTPVDPKLQPVKTAAIVAKNTSKPASTEVWSAKELDLQIEIGTIVRGSIEEFKKRPCFITAKETLSPLTLTGEAAEVLIALAHKDLPCTIIPMPIAGISTPVTMSSNVAIGNAEILGTFTALRSVVPDASVNAGVMSGILDMVTGNASFASPEAIVQDLIYAQLYEEIYGLDFGIGVGCTDSLYPGAQSVIEKMAKFYTAALTDRTNYPVGLLFGAKRFSPEQALIDLEIAAYIDKLTGKADISEDSFVLNLIEKVGPGGNFLQEDHTYENFKKLLWIPGSCLR